MRIGSSRSRRPVAWNTALAIAGATPVMETSPKPLTPALLKVEVRLVDELHLDGADVGIHREHIFGKIGIEEAAIARIDFARFAQGRADAPHHAAADLARGGARAHHAAAIGNADHPRHADTPCAGSIRTSTKCAM